MRSKSVHTTNIDDIEAGAKELAASLMDGFTLAKNSVGILYVYSDMEAADFARLVQEEVPFDVVGCTCIASVDGAGFHDMAATLTVLTCDDCTFAAGVSAPITPGNVQAEIDATYGRVKEALGGEPSLVFLLPPYILEVMLDHYPERLNEIAPGVPVVGGLPSYNAGGDENLTFLRGEASPDRMVLMGIRGGVQPVFEVQNVTGVDMDRRRKVTGAKDNIVYTVNGERFTDYLTGLGLQVDKLRSGNTKVNVVANPLIIESGDEGGERYTYARALHDLNPEDGSGVAIGRVPEGATLAVCSLQGDQITEAAVAGMRALREKMQPQIDAEYQFSTVIAVSCIGRHLLLLPDNTREAARLLEGLPEGLTLTGFYSYGEVGPQGEKQPRNFAHNESLVLCAF